MSKEKAKQIDMRNSAVINSGQGMHSKISDIV